MIGARQKGAEVMKPVVFSVGILLLALSVGMIVCEWKTWPAFQPPTLAAQTIPKGNLPLPEDEIKKSLTEAQSELNRRLERASFDRQWARAANWTAFLLASVLTVIAGSYGTSVKQGEEAAATLAAVMKEQQTSKSLTRLLGAMIALTTLPGMLSQRLEAEAASYTSSGRELYRVYAESRSKLYDPNTSKKDADEALQRLEEATKFPVE
jgi:hypothetical protein